MADQSSFSSSLQFKQWKQLSPSGDMPSVRQGHAVAVVKDKAYLYGGSALNDQGESIFYNDLYSITLTDSNPTWSMIEQTGDIPPAREGHSLIAVEDAIFLCGGIDTDAAETCVKEIFILRTDDNCWSEEVPTGDIPQATSSTMVTTDDGRIIMFGGVLKGTACNDVHILNASTLEWSLAVTSGDSPKPRCDHGCCVADRKMFVFGGSAGDNLWLNDLSYLCLDTMEWVSLGVLDYSPSPRDYSTLNTLTTNKSCDKLLLFGGFSGKDGQDICNNDTFVLAIKDDEIFWNQLFKDSSDSSVPPGRYGHASFSYNNKVYIAGGQDVEKMLEDLWMVEFEEPAITICPTVPPQRNYDTDTPVPAVRKPLEQPIPKEIEPRDFNTLRSQYIGQINEIFDNLTKSYEDLDNQRSMLAAEREQFEIEKKELHETYDRQQKEVTSILENHKLENEKWVEKMRVENDQERTEIAEIKAQLQKEREELDNQKAQFQEKSVKLDSIMSQVKGLTI